MQGVLRCLALLALLGAAVAFAPTPSLRPPHMRFNARISRGPRMTLAMPPPMSQEPLESLIDKIPDCPATKWSVDGIDIAAEQAAYKAEGIPDSPLYVKATPEESAMGIEYFKQNKEKIMAQLKLHGSVLLQGFELTKTPEGFRQAWEAIGLKPCLDPIHTSGLRSMLSAKDAVYEEVNKQSLKKHYIGLHNESTFKKTAAYGAFVCFSPASVEGGEFFIADGAKIFRDLKTDVLERLYNKKVRISVSNLDFDFLNILGPLKPQAMEALKNIVGSTIVPKFDMDLDMIYGTDGKPLRLQAIEHAQSPINRHPDTGKPLWFCNVHNHARYLRDRRPCSVPEVGMTDVYYGDLSHIPAADLEHIDDVSRKHIVDFKMQSGDVLLVDNYRVLHGRDIFEGERLHAVSWFRKGDEELTIQKPGNILNNVINSLIGS